MADVGKVKQCQYFKSCKWFVLETVQKKDRCGFLFPDIEGKDFCSHFPMDFAEGNFPSKDIREEYDPTVYVRAEPSFDKQPEQPKVKIKPSIKTKVKKQVEKPQEVVVDIPLLPQKVEIPISKPEVEIRGKTKDIIMYDDAW